MNYLPLNTDAVTNKVAGIMNGTARPASMLAYVMKSGELPSTVDDDAPDGTGGATKSYEQEPQALKRSKAVDPSQGHGNNRPGQYKDELTLAMERLVNGYRHF